MRLTQEVPLSSSSLMSLVPSRTGDFLANMFSGPPPGALAGGNTSCVFAVTSFALCFGPFGDFMCQRVALQVILLPCYWGWCSLLNFFIILFNLRVEFAAIFYVLLVCLEQCYSKFSLQENASPRTVSSYWTISTESESKHLETFGAL